MAASTAHRSLLLDVLRQGVPLAIGMASHAMFNLVDLVLVGRLGAAAVAGVHVATTINFLPMIVGNGVTVATMSIMARQIGAGRLDEARRVSSRWQVLMLVLGVVLGVAGAVLAVPCVDLQGVTGRARGIGIHYLVVSQLGTVTMFALMQATASMRARGEAVMPFVLLVGANVLNIALDVVLLYGWQAVGVPAFGAPGAAYASVLSRLVFALVGLWWLARPSYPLRLTWSWPRTPSAERRQVLALGLPQSLQMMVRAAAVIALTRVAAELGGADAVVALGVTTRLDTMVLFSAIGFASAATAKVGQSCGAGELRRARAACRWSGLGALAFGGLLIAVFATYARPIMAWFVEGAAEGVLAQGELYLRVAALGQPLAAFCLAVTGGVNGAGRVAVPVVLDVLGYSVLLLPALVVTVLAGGDLEAIWWTFAAGNLALAAGYALYLERGGWPRAVPGLPAELSECQTGAGAELTD